jgi:hypothetical protein
MICTKIVAAVFHFDDFFSCSELAEGSSFTRKALPAHWMPSSVHARLEYEAPAWGEHGTRKRFSRLTIELLDTCPPR